nr:hypothetical protein L203_04111 [Cryptococcus depauperatus CBS 7841]
MIKTEAATRLDSHQDVPSKANLSTIHCTMAYKDFAYCLTSDLGLPSLPPGSRYFQYVLSSSNTALCNDGVEYAFTSNNKHFPTVDFTCSGDRKGMESLQTQDKSLMRISTRSWD